MEKTAFSYRFGTAEFDEARFELRVAGLPVDVERRALEVLAYLLRHAGEVVTKEELLREVWVGRITVDKVLPNAINKLRRALGEANAERIATQARIGYRLDGNVVRTAVGRQSISQLALAAGLPTPGRQHFLLQRQLGSTEGHEVWLAEHHRTHEQRVYKFALDGDRLRALKREVTLLRVLQEGLQDTRHILEVLDWNFEEAPYFLESRYAGPTLTTWFAQHEGSLGRLHRIALFLQIADVVAAAHALGVLHKDLKPANVLVAGGVADSHARLTDFGSGRLLEPDRLEQMGITRMGLTVEDGADLASASGTPLYVAPELFEGHAATVRSDVYALGILLYQLLSGRIGRPMASGWEAEIDDELLCEDLRLATEGDPARRLPSAAELADRLRRLEQRRADHASQQQALEAAQRDREALARAKARRPLSYALFGVLALGIVTSLWLQQRAVSARDLARMQLERANALTRFLNEDLIGRSNPLVSAKGPDATLRDVLIAARDRVPARFASQPETAAAIHGSLAIFFSAVDLFQDAEGEASQALKLLEQRGDRGTEAELLARSVLVRVLSRMGRFDDAAAQLKVLEQETLESTDPMARQRLAAAQSTFHVGRSEFDKAVVSLRAAIAGLPTTDPGNIAPRDTLRLDLIVVLAIAGHDQDALQEAAHLIEEARRRPENTELLIALAHLAEVQALRNDHATAEKLLLEAEPVIVARLGENHSRHLQLLGELLSVSFRQGDWPKAIAYAQRAHERVRAKFGDKHVLTPVTLLNWARTLEEAGRPAEAVEKARSSYAQLHQLVGPSSPQTQDATFVLALIELDLGDAKRAQPLIDQLDPKALKSGQATGKWAASVQALRAMSLKLQGNPRESRALLDSVLPTLKEGEVQGRPSRLYVVADRTRRSL